MSGWLVQSYIPRFPGMKKIIAKRVIHKGEKRISLEFAWDNELIIIIKQIGDVRWSRQMKKWHIPDNGNPIPELLDLFRGHAYVDISDLIKRKSEKSAVRPEEEVPVLGKEHNSKKEGSVVVLSETAKLDIEKFRKWLESNRYPEATVRAYTAMITTFLKFVSPREAGECTTEDIIRIATDYILPNGLSHSYQNQMISALKKFHSRVYRRVIEPVEISRPRPQHRLPNVLSKDEVKRLLNSVANEKHRVMLSVVYGCGLRRSEVLEMIPADIDRDRKLISIRQSKGFKDRLLPISDKLIRMVDDYLTHYKPAKYLFEGQLSGKKYSAESLEKVFRQAFIKAGINKKDITLHGLRHSYATHLLEAGTDLRYIQALLDHKSSRTTEIYTHVTIRSIEKIRSPFDDL